MDITKISDEELLKLKTKVESKVAKLNNTQMSLKILLNSAYGALSNEYFRYFDIRLASAITLSGQLSIKWIEKYLMNHKLQKKFKWECIYSDSVVGATKIYVNGEKISIEKYYENCGDNFIINDDYLVKLVFSIC